jgi:6-phosphogluconolactonase
VAGSGGSGGAGGQRLDGAADAPGTSSDAPPAAPDAPGPVVNPFVFISGYDASIRIFKLDMTSGALMPQGTASGGDSPSYLSWDPARKHLYALNELDPAGRVRSYSINGSTGGLTPINDVPSGGSGPAHLSVHNSGRWVLVSHYTDGWVTVLPVMANGALGATPADRQQPVNLNAHMIVSDSSGSFVFVPCTGPKLVLQFLFNAESGKLTPNMPASVPAAAGAQPRHIAFHPSSPLAYVVNEAGASVTSFAYDKQSGKLSAPETTSAIPAGTSGNGSNVVVHPSGRFVYASMRAQNSIALFNVNPDTGRLTLVANNNGNGMVKTPWDFTVDPSGTFLLVANNAGNTVIVFRINQTDGKLTLVGSPTSAPSPTFVGVMPPP